MNVANKEQKFDLIYIPQNLIDDRDVFLAAMLKLELHGHPCKNVNNLSI